MSKSLQRVRAALQDAGADSAAAGIREMPDQTRTAKEAANAAGVEIDQIAKSIIFRGEATGTAILFVTAGGNQVCADKASELAGESLGKADATLIRAQTGFAIGGVSPVGHLSPIRAFFDPKLAEFSEIWAAAGTPRHVFPLSPDELQKISGAQSAEFTK
jgi:prolyl-tRNA editing enzyme YbaK/EbsC (Cys-tRNA(Pro) deacylase)